MRKKVVVIGGGFAGSYVVKELEKEFDVTLIDTKPYFEFTPGVLRTIVEPEHIRKIQILHSHYLKCAKVIVGNVDEVSSDHVKINSKKILFDYLVISSGSSYNAPFKESGVVIAARASTLKNHYRQLKEAKKVLIIGGGLVGVELAGEILWKYGREREIILVHAKEKLMERNTDKAVRFAEKYLKKKGVKIFHNEKVVGMKGKVSITDRKRKIEADIFFLCTGIVSNYEFMKKYFSSKLNDKNQIKTNEFLQLEGKENIFVAGDIAGVVEEKTAQNAERQAKVVVKNICALERGKVLERYKPKITPMVISLGKRSGIYVNGDFVMTGFVPGLMKSKIEWWEMRKKRRR